MIGILLMYFIGRVFYELAKKHEKWKWSHAIMGILSYYAGAIFGGLFLVAIIHEINPDFIYTVPEFALDLMTVPLGLFTCWLFYFLLKQNWEKKTKEVAHEDVLDDGMV